MTESNHSPTMETPGHLFLGGRFGPWIICYEVWVALFSTTYSARVDLSQPLLACMLNPLKAHVVMGNDRRRGPVGDP